MVMFLKRVRQGGWKGNPFGKGRIRVGGPARPGQKVEHGGTVTNLLHIAPALHESLLLQTLLFLQDKLLARDGAKQDAALIIADLFPLP